MCGHRPEAAVLGHRLRRNGPNCLWSSPVMRRILTHALADRSWRVPGRPHTRLAWLSPSFRGLGLGCGGLFRLEPWPWPAFSALPRLPIPRRRRARRSRAGTRGLRPLRPRRPRPGRARRPPPPLRPPRPPRRPPAPRLPVVVARPTTRRSRTRRALQRSLPAGRSTSRAPRSSPAPCRTCKRAIWSRPRRRSP